MTEEEARKKWCPFTRVRINTQDGRTGSIMAISSANRVDQEAIGACIASACMAWRWRSDFNKIVADHPEAKTPDEIKSWADGFCGLVGAPQ